jgi:hypothetical protein
MSRSGERKSPLHEILLQFGYETLIFGGGLITELGSWSRGTRAGNWFLGFWGRNGELGYFACLAFAFLLLGGEDFENVM